MVALVTRAHARLLEDGHPFCSCLAAQAISSIEPHQVDLLAAVVDGVTAPVISAGNHSAEQNGFRENGAFEGISIMLTSSEIATPDLWSTRQWPEEQQSPTVQQTCTLSFEFAGGSVDVGGAPLPYELVPPSSRRLQLPVSNTIFQNGNTSTLLAQRWTLANASATEPAMLQTKKAYLPQQKVYMKEFANPNGVTVPCILKLPLTAITPPRTVATSVGNIVRTLIGINETNEDDSTPASTELEICVSRWMESQNHSVQRAYIWALITPPGSPVSGLRSRDISLQLALESGSRLHRVLSGGGSFGAKQGLLSLDPETGYGEWHQSGFNYNDDDDDDDDDDDSDIESLQRQAFGEVVRQGDTVTFYVFDPALTLKNQSDDVSLQSCSWSTTTWPSILMATIPSGIDAMPAPAPTERAISDVQSLYARNHFGMASEGMAFTVSRSIDDRSKQMGSPLQTKIDVPYAYYSVRMEPPKVFSEPTLGNQWKPSTV